MSIGYQILGKSFHDNSLFVTVNPGESRHHILFDCGENCLTPLKPSRIMAIDHLCFSHFHLDHVAGFDRFLRMTYNRTSKPVRLWGPESAIEIMHHRLRGVTWDLVADESGEWIITAIGADTVEAAKLYTSEEFREIHPQQKDPYQSTVFEHVDYSIQACVLSHRTPSIAYRVTEPPNLNIDREALTEAGLQRGPWLNKVKDLSLEDSQVVAIGDHEYTLGKLRENLLVESSGESIAYVTDCIYEKNSIAGLIEMIHGCDVLVCESTYTVEDAELASENSHLTTHQAARIAQQAEIGQLVLMHFSDRYQSEGAEILLDQAKEVFPDTVLPENWDS